MRLYRIFAETKDGNLPVVLSGCKHSFNGDFYKYNYYFVLPEQVKDITTDGKLRGHKITIECIDVPFDKMKGNFGLFEYYEDWQKYASVVGVRLMPDDVKDLKSEISNDIHQEWLNEDVYRNYLAEKIKLLAPVQKGYNPVINENYNFKRLFDKDTLKQEGVDVSDYDQAVLYPQNKSLLTKVRKLIKKDTNKEL